MPLAVIDLTVPEHLKVEHKTQCNMDHRFKGMIKLTNISKVAMACFYSRYVLIFLRSGRLTGTDVNKTNTLRRNIKS